MKTAIATITFGIMLCGVMQGQVVVVRTVDTPFSNLIQGTCEGEPVALTGMLRTFWKRSETTDGIIRIDTKSSIKGEGVGLDTGVHYNLSEKQTTRMLFSSAGIVSVSWENKMSLVGPGPDNDMVITFVTLQIGDEIVLSDFKGVCK